jgi:type I restriction enzyme, S subunit
MRIVKLRDISDLKTGPFGTQFSASEYVSNGIPVINVKNIGYGSISAAGLDYVGENTLERLSEHKLKAGDIVFGRKGSVDRHCLICREQEGWMQGSDCIRVRFIDDSVYPEFVSYFLLTNAVKIKINNSAVGSTMASLNTGILGDIDITLPEYTEQKRIALILGEIDKKISKNNMVNDYLEEMAKTIYNYWFVQFDFPDKNGNPYKSSGGKMQNISDFGIAPSDWKTGNLYDIANFINGLACQKYRPNENESSLPVIKIREMHEGISVDSERVKADLPQNNIVNTGDILFSWSASLEVQRWAGTTGGLNQHIFKVIPNDGYTSSYVYHQLKAYVVKFIQMAEARKTTMGHITSDHLKQSVIVLPPENVIQKFSNSVDMIHAEISCINMENQKLCQIRDWLLPMLMNGQTTIED